MIKSASFNLVATASLLLVAGNLLTAQNNSPSGFDLGSIFILDDTEIMKERVNMHVQKKSIDDILDLLSMLTGLKAERQGKTIKFVSQ